MEDCSYPMRPVYRTLNPSTNSCSFAQDEDVRYILAGDRVLVQRLGRPCIARVAVYNLLVPFVRAIIGSVTSPRRSHYALAFEPSTMWSTVRYSHGLCAARSPVMSLAHEPHREACNAGGPGGVAIETRSARPANASCAAQHVEPRTRAHTGPRVFQIHTNAAILAVHVVVSYQSRDVSTPAPDHGVVRAWAVRKTRNGPRTQCPAEPAQSPK